MKITFLLPHAGFSGGIRVVAIYAEALQKRGHTVTVVSLPSYRPTLWEQIKSVARGRGLLPIASQGSHLDAVSVTHRVLESHRPITDADVPDGDVVIATWWETAEWIAALSPQKGAKVYFVQHCELFDYLPKERVEATYRSSIYKIAVSQWIKDTLIRDYQNSVVSLIPNGVELDRFFAAPRSKQPIPTVGMIYTDTFWKGCDICLNAFYQAQKVVPELRLVAFSSYPPNASLPLPENSQFFLKPSQETIREIYSTCDAWLFASRSEGFGLPILEAMACRTPVISTPVGIAPEIVTEGSGILIPPEDAVAMARAICQVCEMTEQQWKAMSDEAHRKVMNYTWEDAVIRFEAALYDAVRRSQTSEYIHGGDLSLTEA